MELYVKSRIPRLKDPYWDNLECEYSYLHIKTGCFKRYWMWRNKYVINKGDVEDETHFLCTCLLHNIEK